MTQTAGSEFLSVALTVTPETIELGDMARLSLKIDADRHVTLLGHSLDSALTEGDHKFEYRVHPLWTQEARPTFDGRLQWTYTYDLEFFLAGDFDLSAVEVSYLDSRESDSGTGDAIDNHTTTERVLTTEPLSVSVRLPAGTTLTEAQMREVHRLDPVELSTPRSFRGGSPDSPSSCCWRRLGSWSAKGNAAKHRKWSSFRRMCGQNNEWRSWRRKS